MVVPETSITIVDEEFIKLQRIFIRKLFFLSSHFRAHRLSATSKLNFLVYIFVRWRGSIALLCLYLLYVVFWLHDFLSRFLSLSLWFCDIRFFRSPEYVDGFRLEPLGWLWKQTFDDFNAVYMSADSEENVHVLAAFFLYVCSLSLIQHPRDKLLLVWVLSSVAYVSVPIERPFVFISF